MFRFLFRQTHDKTNLFLLKKVFGHFSLFPTDKLINLTYASLIFMFFLAILTKNIYATFNMNIEVILYENSLIFNTPALKLIKLMLKQIFWFADRTKA